MAVLMVLSLPVSYRVCEVLYGKKRQFSNVLSCYWRDPNRKVIILLLSIVDKRTNASHRSDFKRAVGHQPFS